MFTLGELIKRLTEEDPTRVVPLGFGTPHSYRGYYDNVSFSPKENVTIGEMLRHAKSALGATFSGWKGGEYTMHEFSPVWISEEGCVSGQSIGDILLDYMFGRY